MVQGLVCPASFTVNIFSQFLHIGQGFGRLFCEVKRAVTRVAPGTCSGHTLVITDVAQDAKQCFVRFTQIAYVGLRAAGSVTGDVAMQAKIRLIYNRQPVHHGWLLNILPVSMLLFYFCSV